jgi:hypothetical protein
MAQLDDAYDEVGDLQTESDKIAQEYVKEYKEHGDSQRRKELFERLCKVQETAPFGVYSHWCRCRNNL